MLLTTIFAIVYFFRSNRKEAIDSTSVDTKQNLKLQELEGLIKQANDDLKPLKNIPQEMEKMKGEYRTLNVKVDGVKEKVEDGQQNLKEQIKQVSDQVATVQQQTNTHLETVMEGIRKLVNLEG